MSIRYAREFVGPCVSGLWPAAVADHAEALEDEPKAEIAELVA